MKKSLLALAALSAFATAAQAQSSVSVYGVLSAGYGSTEFKDTVGTPASVKVKTSGAEGQQAGSRLGFRGTEDLGGGMKAGFVYELGADLDTGLATNRLGYLDLSGSFGTVRAGRVDGLVRQIYNTYTAHGNSGFQAGNLAASITGAGTATTGIEALGYTAAQAADVLAMQYAGATGRISNTIGYNSPTMGGFGVQVQWGQVESDTSATANKLVTQDTQNIGLTYAAGKFAAQVAQEKSTSKTEAATSVKTEFTTNAIGASYDFGVAKAFATYIEREREVSGTARNTEVEDLTVGVSVPVGSKVVLVASYSDGDLKNSQLSADSTGSLDLSAYQLQANYLLSKRTKAYVMYGESEIKGSNGKIALDGYVVGVQHSF
jgi:predicted porin